jgi:hypothetical protein
MMTAPDQPKGGPLASPRDEGRFLRRDLRRLGLLDRGVWRCRGWRRKWAASRAANYDEPEKPDLAALENDFVRVFLGDTTFEREITIEGNLGFLGLAAKEIGAPRVAKKLTTANEAGGVAAEGLKNSVLATAKRFGKARHAQVAARHVDNNAKLPAYIAEAVTWLLEK